MTQARPSKQLGDAAGAALTDKERRVIERLLARLREELGGDLLAVWLYGSRARGAADLGEADPGRRAGRDLVVLVDPSRDADELSWKVTPMVEAIADAEGDSPVYYSVLVYDADRLRNRREIRSFFFSHVDRAKSGLAGRP